MAEKKKTKRSKKKLIFSATKAVKANARERVGQPKPGRVLPDPKARAAAHPKHKVTLGQLLESDPDA